MRSKALRDRDRWSSSVSALWRHQASVVCLHRLISLLHSRFGLAPGQQQVQAPARVWEHRPAAVASAACLHYLYSGTAPDARGLSLESNVHQAQAPDRQAALAIASCTAASALKLSTAAIYSGRSRSRWLVEQFIRARPAKPLTRRPMRYLASAAQPPAHLMPSSLPPRRSRSHIAAQPRRARPTASHHHHRRADTSMSVDEPNGEFTLGSGRPVYRSFGPNRPKGTSHRSDYGVIVPNIALFYAERKFEGSDEFCTLPTHRIDRKLK